MSDVDYTGLDASLQGCGSDYGPAEAHGIFCGLYAVGHEAAEALWAKLVLDPARATAPDSRVAQFATLTANALAADDFSFSLLLPDDDEPLSARAAALGAWCQGFLYGWGMGGVRDVADEQEEILRDFSDIATISDEVDQDNIAEQSFMEVCEYVRTGVMLLYESR